jgi:dihydropteroate synthase
MIDEGADVIDIGGESTRPGMRPVPAAVELERVLPVLGAVRRDHPGVAISVDTSKAVVAGACLAEGADAINDVTGLREEPAIADAAAAAGAGLVLMHSRGGMEQLASYELATYGDDVVGEVCEELRASVARAGAAGVPAEALVVDPGIGFSKRTEHSVAMLRGIDRLASLGFPVMVGASRKRVIGELTGEKRPGERDRGTVGAHVAALARGARLFRVHDVRAHREALDVAWQILR